MFLVCFVVCNWIFQSLELQRPLIFKSTTHTTNELLLEPFLETFTFLLYILPTHKHTLSWNRSKIAIYLQFLKYSIASARNPSNSGTSSHNLPMLSAFLVSPSVLSSIISRCSSLKNSLERDYVQIRHLPAPHWVLCNMQSPIMFQVAGKCVKRRGFSYAGSIHAW